MSSTKSPRISTGLRALRGSRRDGTQAGRWTAQAALALRAIIAGLAEGIVRISSAQPLRHSTGLAARRALVFGLAVLPIAPQADRASVRDPSFRDSDTATLDTLAPRPGELLVATAAEWTLLRRIPLYLGELPAIPARSLRLVAAIVASAAYGPAATDVGMRNSHTTAVGALPARPGEPSVASSAERTLL